VTATGVHPTAVVDPNAQLGSGVQVGPYAIVGPHVQIGDDSVIGPHVVVEGRTRIGSENRLFQFAAIGAIPQDLKYKGEESQLIIGDRNTFREFVTAHAGTAGGGMVTRIGNGNLLMNYVHVAHDCILGDANILANGVQLGGHVTIESYVVVGALSGVHQFVRLGESAIVGAGSMVSQDVPPFCNATGDRARLHGLNALGLKRRGLSAEQTLALKRAFRTMFRSGLKVAEAAARIRSEHEGSAEVERFVAFIEASERGVSR
jgi:UDP-N-acetylglucosamine acyltransferase